MNIRKKISILSLREIKIHLSIDRLYHHRMANYKFQWFGIRHKARVKDHGSEYNIKEMVTVPLETLN